MNWGTIGWNVTSLSSSYDVEDAFDSRETESPVTRLSLPESRSAGVNPVSPNCGSVEVLTPPSWNCIRFGVATDDVGGTVSIGKELSAPGRPNPPNGGSTGANPPAGGRNIGGSPRGSFVDCVGSCGSPSGFAGGGKICGAAPSGLAGGGRICGAAPTGFASGGEISGAGATGFAGGDTISGAAGTGFAGGGGTISGAAGIGFAGGGGTISGTGFAGGGEISGAGGIGFAGGVGVS